MVSTHTERKIRMEKPERVSPRSHGGLSKDFK